MIAATAATPAGSTTSLARSRQNKQSPRQRVFRHRHDPVDVVADQLERQLTRTSDRDAVSDRRHAREPGRRPGLERTRERCRTLGLHARQP